jgi:hypothetical protein
VWWGWGIAVVQGQGQGVGYSTTPLIPTRPSHTLLTRPQGAYGVDSLTLSVTAPEPLTPVAVRPPATGPATQPARVVARLLPRPSAAPPDPASPPYQAPHPSTSPPPVSCTPPLSLPQPEILLESVSTNPAEPTLVLITFETGGGQQAQLPIGASALVVATYSAAGGAGWGRRGGAEGEGRA